MNKIYVILIFLISFTSCSPTRSNIFAPNKKLFKMLPDGPPDFQQGWLDGCESGMATGFANDYYKTFYHYKKDMEEIRKGNKRYLRPWSSAMIYCRHYALGTLKEAGMSPTLPGQLNKAPIMSFGHDSLLGDVWNPKNQGAFGLDHW